MMRRRPFIGAVGARLFAPPLLAHAQPNRTLRRIGLLEPGTVPAEPKQWPPTLMQGLHDLGWIEGQNIVIERRSAGDKRELVPALAAELVRLEVDVIVTFGSPAAMAERKATSTIPIVTAVIGDPIRADLAASLARPGGNVTGNTLIEAELRDKRLGGSRLRRAAFSYGYDISALFKRIATLVDRILKGANPADVPVEQVNVHELVVNLRTARAGYRATALTTAASYEGDRMTTAHDVTVLSSRWTSVQRSSYP